MSYPIILAHGVCRFDKLWSKVFNLDNSDDPDVDRLHYFKSIRTMLKGNGFAVYHANVGWAAAVDTRAVDLRKAVYEILQKDHAEKVNIICHSMAGLDARHMLFNDRKAGRIHERIASVTTISTPHWGSSFADWGIANLPHLIPVAHKLGLDLDAFYDLTTKKCREFNDNAGVEAFEAECEAAVQFQTYAGRQGFWGVFDALKLPYYIIEKEEGDNDGLVSVESAKWRDRYFKGVIDNTDHLNEIGWWDTAQIFAGESEAQLLTRIHAFYLSIAARLP